MTRSFEPEAPPRQAGSSYVDLHCHILPGVDDGARDLEESLELVTGLVELGFTRLVATPHLRPGVFDLPVAELRARHAEFSTWLADTCPKAEVTLSAEHYYDDVNHRRLLCGEGLPYPAGHAALVELGSGEFPSYLERRLAELIRARLVPVLAHPERCRSLTESSEPLARLLDLGVLALLDLGALVGGYGARAETSAHRLLEEGCYFAACSDAHRPSDLEMVRRAIERLGQLVGDEERRELLSSAPLRLLAEPALP